jgi:hypothetical protein
MKEGVQLQGDLAAISRRRAARGKAIARAIIGDGAREFAHGRLYPYPRFKRASSSGFKYYRWLARTGRQDAQRVSSSIHAAKVATTGGEQYGGASQARREN